jgi:hypothetical protein
LRILALFVRHGTTAYPNAEQELMDFYARLKGVDATVLTIDNALTVPADPATSGITVIPGDNSAWEFSAWDNGIQHMGAQIWSFDLVHLATSAFNTLYTAYIARVSPAMLEWAAERPIFLGHIDCFNEPVQLLSYCSQHWTRSCFIFLRPTELKALGSLVSIQRDAGLFSGDPLAPFSAKAPLSANYQQNITMWLTGADIGQGVRWHSAFELTPDRLRYFEDKTLAILNEHLLSIRLRAMDAVGIDITWLQGKLALTQNPPRNVRWLQQLRERQVDAVTCQGPAVPADR